MFINKYGGINDIPGCDKRVYNLWYQMLRRCYDDTQHGRNRGKSYADCDVSGRWMRLSNFAMDLPELPGYYSWLTKPGYCLDKDTIIPGNRIYGKEYCCFLTNAENIRDIHNRHPENIRSLHESNKTKYAIFNDDEIIIFDSEKDACKYLGVVNCSVASCYRKGVRCKGYRIKKLKSSEDYEND